MVIISQGVWRPVVVALDISERPNGPQGHVSRVPYADFEDSCSENVRGHQPYEYLKPAGTAQLQEIF